jgi:hypothetical protein
MKKIFTAAILAAITASPAFAASAPKSHARSTQGLYMQVVPTTAQGSNLGWVADHAKGYER